MTSEKPTSTDVAGPWDSGALAQLEIWDTAWAGIAHTMSTNPWNGAVLPKKFAELVSIAINVACTNLNRDGTARHIRAALDAGASRDEILTIFKMASVMSIHSCSLAAPILLEEAASAGRSVQSDANEPTPACDRMKQIGQWNQAWDPFFNLDPKWTDQFMATGAQIYVGKVFSPKEIELLSIAFDASYTHMYAPGTRRHIRGALAAGASVAEIMDVLKICVSQGMQALNLGIPLLVEELGRRAKPA